MNNNYRVTIIILGAYKQMTHEIKLKQAVLLLQKALSLIPYNIVHYMHM